MKPSAQMLRLLPDVDTFLERTEPELLIEAHFSGPEQALTSQTIRNLPNERADDDSGLESMEPEKSVTAVVDDERLRVLEAGRRGMEKIRGEGDLADLAPDEQFGL